MARFRTIQYGITQEGFIISRVGIEIAHPVLDWNGMTPQNGYEMGYNLEKFNIFDIISTVNNTKWTRKIPAEVKNKHREFWGFKPIKEK